MVLVFHFVINKIRERGGGEKKRDRQTDRETDRQRQIETERKREFVKIII